MKQDRRAAMEMSVGTIVTIVLLMSVLVLGLVLIRSIFTVATDSVDDLGQNIKSELTQLFTDEARDVVVKLGSDNTARLRVGTESFGVAIAAKSSSGDASQLQYKISLDDNARTNCVRELGERQTENLLHQEVGQWIPFDEWDGENGYARIQFTIPKGTIQCTQKLFVDVRDNTAELDVGRTSFSIQIIGRFF